MENNIKENTLKVIENLKNKEFGFYFIYSQLVNCHFRL